MRQNAVFIGKNFMRMILLLVGVSIVAFVLISASPVDPLQANVGQAALGSMSQEQIAKLQEYWGVGQPPLGGIWHGRRTLSAGTWGLRCFTARV